MGYFANAQYDVKSPIVGVADTSPARRTRPFCRYRDISPVSAGESTPKEEAKLHVILNEVKNPAEELTGIYCSLKSWDILLTLNMTHYYFRFLLRGKWHEVPIGDKIFGNLPSREFASSLRFLAKTVNFPCHRINVERANLLARVCERRYS